jgi:iron complex outermembrane receptor protein
MQVLRGINAFKRARHGAAGASALALSVAVAAPAFAQASEEGRVDSSSPVQQMVVTAQFREQPLQDTPLAITAISGELLTARGQTDVTEIAAQAPNVTLEEGVGQRGGGLIAYIRGIGQYNASPALEAGVGTYIDEVYVATMQSSFFNLLDLDRIEILRGPQGTLAGKNSIGGAVKLFTVKPRGDGTGYAELGYGAFDRIQGRAAADFAVADNLFVRINGAARSEDGYVRRLDYACAHPGSGLAAVVARSESCVLGTAGDRSYVAGRIAVRWLPSDRLEVNVSADYTDDFSGPPAEQLGAIDIPALVPSGPLVDINGVGITSDFITAGTYVTYSDYCNPNAFGGTGAYCNEPAGATDTWGVLGTIDVRLTDSVSLKSITAHRGFRSDLVSDSDGTPFPVSNITLDGHGGQFSQELRIVGSLWDALDFTFGGFYLKQKLNLDQRVDIQYINFLFFNNDDANSSNTAGYAEITWSPLKRLHLTGGVRYTRETKDYLFFRTLPDGSNTPIPGLFGLEGHFTGDSFDYRANVSVDITDDLMIYGQFATGFKGGGTNGQPFFPDQVYPFGPETIDTYEAGLKTELADRRVTVNLAGFYSDYTDIQLQAQTCPPPSTPFPCAGPQNVGSAHIKGVEAEVFAQPMEGLTIDGSLAYLDFGYYELRDTPNITLGMKPPFTPKWSWSVGVQYVIDLGGAGALIPRIDASHRSAIFTDPANGPANLIEKRTLANGRLTWRSPDGDWEVALEGTNLFNKYYYENVIDNVRFVGISFTYPAPPRRWLISVRRTF